MSKSKHPNTLVGSNSGEHQISSMDYRRAVERAKKKQLKRSRK